MSHGEKPERKAGYRFGLRIIRIILCGMHRPCGDRIASAGKNGRRSSFYEQCFEFGFRAKRNCVDPFEDHDRSGFGFHGLCFLDLNAGVAR